ncbi:MAG: tRNA (N6-threonylcarbamoyladenosine(37)-N6)-methyltransferase TrmO [Bacillota bacterium]
MDSKNREIHRSELKLTPVGIVKNDQKEPVLVAESGGLKWQAGNYNHGLRDTVSELVIDPEYNDCLEGIEGFSHLLVLYWAHLVEHDGRLLIKVHPMGRKDLPLTGLFATCSPARPNPICAIVVRLVDRKKNILKVQGLDAIDGSPILDLKPYNPGYYPADEIRVADWMEQIYRERKGKI